MAATGVLPFIRGVDLSGNDFKVPRRSSSLAAALPAIEGRAQPVPVTVR